MRGIIFTALLVGVLVGCDDPTFWWPTNTYSRPAWLETVDAERYKFAKNIIGQGLLLKKNRSEVLYLLGAPSYTDPQTDYVTYILKSDTHGVSVLDVRFNATGPNSVVKNVFVRSL